MSKIQNLLEINKKFLAINYSNRESIEIAKNNKAFNYISKLHDCYESNEENEKKFFHCIINNICPEETSSFMKCQSKNQNNLSVCAPSLLSLEDCMTKNINNLLSVLSKTKNF